MHWIRNISLRLVVLVATVGLCPAILTGQIITKKLLFTHISIDDGLSQGMITDIIQDQYGFMWFGTKDGLNQYDGYRFTVYRHNPDEPSSLSESHTTALMEDRQGRIWVGTISGRVDFFDRNAGTFRHVIEQGRFVTSGSVNTLVEDGKGNIHALIGNTIIEINGKTLEQKETSGVPSNNHYLEFGLNSTMYYMHGTSLFIRSLTNGKTDSVPLSSQFLQKLWPEYSKHITRIIEYPSMKQYLVFFYGGVMSINSDTKIIEDVFPYNLGFADGAHIDKHGDVWINANGRIVKFSVRDRSFTEIQPKNQEHATKFEITRSYQDRGGIFWMGSKGYGLFKHDPYTEKFHHTDDNSIYSILEHYGKILVNRTYNDLFQLDPVKGIYVDTLKISTGRQFIGHRNEFNTLLKDGSKRWFSLDTAIASFDLETNEFKIYPTPTIRGDKYQPISSINKDGNANLWVGTDDGLFRFNLKNQSWKIYRNDPSDSTSLSFNSIFTLCLDPGNPGKYLWVGTDGGGLNRLDMETGKFKRYLVKNGLPNNVVYGILPDDDGNLWMSTNNGLSSLDPVNNKFRNFDVNDGLQSNEFNHDAFAKDKDGRMYFGGVNGLNYFYPKEVSTNPITPNVVITDMKINNKAIAGLSEFAALSKALYLNDSIRLSYDQNMISFEFAALDFSAPMKNQYQYKLENFNDDWIYSNNTNTATYTNLDPGTYVFRVKGSNKDGIWNEDGASITITILPPWYGTWWFRALMVLTFLLAVYAIYRYRLQQALKLVAVRNRIATDLHDEIGSNLSNISIFSNVAQQIDDNEKNVSLLKKISDYSQASQESMSDIVWMINPDNDRFENIMTQMRRYAAEIFEAINCNFIISFDEKLNGIKLSMDERKNLYLIYKEAINNLAKYSGCSEVSIELKLSGGMINMVLKDNGKGFDLDAVGKGNGLTNMRKRAEMLKGRLTINTSQGKGTEIALVFPA